MNSSESFRQLDLQWLLGVIVKNDCRLRCILGIEVHRDQLRIDGFKEFHFLNGLHFDLGRFLRWLVIGLSRGQWQCNQREAVKANGKELIHSRHGIRSCKEEEACFVTDEVKCLTIIEIRQLTDSTSRY